MIATWALRVADFRTFIHRFFGGERAIAARMACHLLETCTDDLLLRILSSVSTAADLARLSLTCRHFGAPVGKGRREHSAREGQLCLVQQAGRRWLAMCSDQELSWVPRRGCENWLWLMHEVELLRLPLAFAHAQYGVALLEASAVAARAPGEWCTGYSSAHSGAAMRAGRHAAKFSLIGFDDLLVGVVRTDVAVDEVNDDMNGDRNNHCLYDVSQGTCFPADSEWPGHQAADGAMPGSVDTDGVEVGDDFYIPEGGDTIGMVLDVDVGTLTLYKNDALMGVMHSGLSAGAEYHWAVSLGNAWQPVYGYRVRISSMAVPPAAPSAEELAEGVTRGELYWATLA
jgi:hypothetical protein